MRRRLIRRPAGAVLVPFSPFRLSGLFAYYDSTQGITLGAGVSSWADQAGVQHLNQGSLAGQPAYVASDGFFLGMPSVDFDGSNDFLVTPGPVSEWRFLHDGTGGEVLAVARIDGGAGTNRTLLATTSTSASLPGMRVFANTGNNWQVSLHNGSTIVNVTVSGMSAPVGSVRFVSASFGGTTVRIQVDAVSATGTVSSPSSANPPAPMRLGSHAGGGLFFNGRLAHCAIYRRVLTASERDTYRNWLRNRYGLA